MPHRFRTGAYAIIMAFVIVSLVAFAALAIDIAWVRMAQQQAKSVADAAAHAAMTRFRQTNGDTAAALTEAQAVAAMNTVAGLPVQGDSIEIEFGDWDFDTRTFTVATTNPNAVRATVSRDSSTSQGPVGLFLAPVLGWDTMDVRGASIAATQWLEICVAMDTTGSFKEEIGNARDGLLTFLQILEETGGDKTEIGMVLYTGETSQVTGCSDPYLCDEDDLTTIHSPWTTLQNIPANYAAISAQWATLDWCDKPSDNTRNHMLDCDAGGDGTHQATGIRDCTDHLVAEGNPAADKLILLVSDGIFQCYANPSCNAAERGANGIAEADRAWQNRIDVYSASFNEGSSAIQTAYLESLVRGTGQFFETSDPDDLVAMFEEIAASLPTALVD